MASSTLIFAVVTLGLAAGAWACAVPHGACRPSVCASYSGVSVDTVVFPDADYDDPATWSQGSLPLIGYYLGKYNKAVNGGSYNRAGVKDTPGLNLERFDFESEYATPSSETTIEACCTKCAETDDCYLFHFFPADTPADFANGVQCYLLKGGTQTWDYPVIGTPMSGSFRRQTVGARTTIPLSFVGGRCNGTTGFHDDPHFTGARGTRFDFNGRLDKSVCLASDERLHINGLLQGYQTADDDTRAASKGALRTWVKQVAFLFKDSAGVSHTLHMTARSGTQQERGAGFISSATLDGNDFPLPSTPGSSFEAGDVSLTFVGTKATAGGRQETDHYQLRIAGLLDMILQLRNAHPQLQAPDDAEAHFNLLINELKSTERVHGVLGQTYRASPEQVAKALKYSELTRLLHAPVQADGRSGAGFLEGQPLDYETSSVTAPDCKFSAFQ